MSRKVTELIQTSDCLTFSYELTPGISEEVLKNLDFEPLFFSITWHGLTHGSKNLDIPPLRLANYLRRKGKDVLLHITCTNMRKDFLNDLLRILQEKGICNLFIILGENFDPNRSDFTNTQELVKYIRQCTGHYFCIGVAGFPDNEDKMLHLKQKIDSGVDFIITQAFFDYTVYDNFLAKCKEMEINMPIITGIFPFETSKDLEGFINLCKIHITHETKNLLVKKSGNEIVENILMDLITKVNVKHFHFFTLNKIDRTATLVERVKSFLNMI